MFENLCGNCKHKNCCTDSGEPLVFSSDLKNIRKKDADYTRHIKTIEVNGKLVNAVRKKEDSTECVYWDNYTGKCQIYESRPMDCRLYPFDILYVDDAYHWIVYSCNKDSDWSWSEEHLKNLENYSGFADLMENIDIFSDNTKRVISEEYEKAPFVILRKIKW